MKSGLKCKLNVSGMITGDFLIPPDAFKSEEVADAITIPKNYVTRLFNEFLGLLKQTATDQTESG